MSYNLTSEALHFYVKHLRTRFFYKWVRYVKEKKQSAVQLKLQTDKALLFFVHWRLRSCIRQWITFVYETVPQMTLSAEDFYIVMLNRIAFGSWKHRYVYVVSMEIRADGYYRQSQMPVLANLFSLWRTTANAHQTIKIYAYADDYWTARRLRLAFTAWRMKSQIILTLQPRLRHLMAKISRTLMEDAFWSLKEAYQKATQRRKDVQEALEYYSAQKATLLMRYIIEQGIGFVRAEDTRRAAAVAKKAEETYLQNIFKDRRNLLNSFLTSVASATDLKESDQHITEAIDLNLPNPICATVHDRKSDSNSRVLSANTNLECKKGTGVQSLQESKPRSGSRYGTIPVPPRTQPRTLQKVQPHGAKTSSQPLNKLDIPKDISVYSCTEEPSPQASLTVEDERLLTQYMDSYDVVLKELGHINNQMKMTEAAIDRKTAELATTPYPQTMQLEILSLKMQREELVAQLEHKNAQSETLRVILAEYKSKLIS
ncbi:Hypothetical protein GLP15_1291 [Giardia lamblia P15]|uniref:Uncharacterized protein n=1 Tax=Giardia intestinalis (strain P15) TaxID=658858 RepID=E1F8B2_GIAIA|nr:Hypothetical protein GLP15_1291 [Giardia lamblia P15]